MQSQSIVQVEGLFKRYGTVNAVDKISFEVYPGEIFGMVGPNGAGKTTTIECLEGLRKPDTGVIRVLGLDPQMDKYKLREKIGIQLQESQLQERVKVFEALDLFASFYANSLDYHILLEKVGLRQKERDFFAKLSGGQKQRLFIALALINNPTVVFLDELTTGLDPQARHAMWDFVKEIRSQGKTVFLTTHYMEEAERLCDRVAIIDNGQIVALDTPENLVKSLSIENRVVFNIDGIFDVKMLSSLAGVLKIEQINQEVIVYGRGDRLVADIVNTLTANRVRFNELQTERSNLEDVFLSLTGRKIRD